MIRLTQIIWQTQKGLQVKKCLVVPPHTPDHGFG